MGRVTVADILQTPLADIDVPGGNVLHAMKNGDPGYVDFGEAYFSIIDFAYVKAWKRHKRMTLNLVNPVGSVRFVFVDDSGAVLEIDASRDNYSRITVPPTIWFGFQGLSESSSLVLNMADIRHDPAEVERKDIQEINYSWKDLK